MSTSAASLSSPASLQAVISRISAMDDLSRQRRQDLASAVRRVAVLIGLPPQDIAPDPGAIRKRLALFTPAAAGVTPRRWQNIKAAVSAALNLTGVKVVRRRISERLPLDWAELLGRVSDRYERTRLSRFAGDCAAKGIAPGQVDNAVAEAFGTSLLKGSLIDRPKQVYRELCLAWNRCADAIPGWPAIRLTVPDHRRTYALPLTAYPNTFSADLQAWLDHLAGKDLFAETARRPASPATLKSTRQLVLQFAAALVHAGRDPASITRLADLVAIDAAKAGLEFFWERAGQQKTGHLHQYGLLLVKLAKHWVRVTPAQLERLQAMRKRVDPGRTDMTPRNRARLRQFDDDVNLTRLINLPRAILRALPTDAPLGYEQAVRLQSGLAIAILLIAPMRIKNLASLDLERHIIQTRAGGPRHLVIPGTMVKNGVPLEFVLPVEVSDLLDVYLRRARPALSAEPSSFLFPARGGGAKPEAQLAVQVKKVIAREAGLDLNVHAFRHLAARLFLRQFPGEYETVRLLLGHKSLTTTVRAYCGLEQADALRRYDNLIDAYRQTGRDAHAA